MGLSDRLRSVERRVQEKLERLPQEDINKAMRLWVRHMAQSLGPGFLSLEGEQHPLDPTEEAFMRNVLRRLERRGQRISQIRR